MRRKTSFKGAERSTLCTLLSPTLRDLSSALGFDVNLCHHADIVHTKALLTSLKTAVELYLDTNFCFARFGIAGVKENMAGIVDETLEAIGIRQISLPLSAGYLAVPANMYDAQPMDNELPWVILAVDYSSYGFSLGLYTKDEDAILDMINEEYHPYVDPVRKVVDEEPSHLDRLRDALQLFYSNAPADLDLPMQIQHLVVYGDLAESGALRRLLTTILGADLVQRARVSNLVFGGTTILAKLSYATMNRIDFRDKPAFGCRWRSNLYDQVRTKL